MKIKSKKCLFYIRNYIFLKNYFLQNLKNFIEKQSINIIEEIIWGTFLNDLILRKIEAKHALKNKEVKTMGYNEGKEGHFCTMIWENMLWKEEKGRGH